MWLESEVQEFSIHLYPQEINVSELINVPYNNKQIWFCFCSQGSFVLLSLVVSMFQLPLVFNNEITRYEYVPKRNYISVHCQQQWQTATRLGLLIMIVLLLYLRVMSGCTTGLSVCSHRHLISELQGRSQSIAPFHSASLFLFSIFFSAAAASPDSVTCPPV